RFHARLLDVLGEKIGLTAPHLEDVAARLSAHHIGLPLISSHVITDEFCQQGIDTMETFIDFWDRMPLPRHAPPLVIVLSIKRTRGRDWFQRWWCSKINRRITAALQRFVAIEGRSTSICVLPELTPVSSNEAQQWALDDN